MEAVAPGGEAGGEEPGGKGLRCFSSSRKGALGNVGSTCTPLCQFSAGL